IRLVETTNRKGDCLGDRQHRIAELAHVPDYLNDGWANPIPVEKLKAVAELAREGSKRVHSAKGTFSLSNGSVSSHAPQYSRRLNMQRYLSSHGRNFKATADGGFELTCVFHDDHTAAFHQDADGTPGYHCFHNRCCGMGWEQASEKIGKPHDADYDRIEK